VVYKAKIDPPDLLPALNNPIEALPQELDNAVVPQHLQLLADLGPDVLVHWVKPGEVVLEL